MIIVCCGHEEQPEEQGMSREEMQDFLYTPLGCEPQLVRIEAMLNSDNEEVLAPAWSEGQGVIVGTMVPFPEGAGRLPPVECGLQLVED
jgi:hypothetical protein